MLERLNHWIVAVMDVLLGWLLRLPSDLQLIAVALGSAIILTAVRVWTSNQDLLRRCRDDKARLKTLIREAKKRRERIAVRRHRSTLGMIAMKQLRQEVRPLLASLLPIVRVGDGISGFCVHPSTGLKSIKELVDYVKANPGKMPFGTPGAGTSGHMRLEMLSHRAGIKFLHVPYRGGAEVLNDLLTGTVQIANDPTNNAAIKAGKVKLLCVNHSTRSPDFPDVPTLTEAGYPNSDVPLWFCLWAPTGVPQPIVDALHAKVTEIAKLPETAARLLLVGMLSVTSTQAELQAFREAEIKTTSELIKLANIKLE